MPSNETTLRGAEQSFFVMPQTSDALVYPVSGPATTSAGGPMRVLSSDVAPVRGFELHEHSQEGQGAYEGQHYPTMLECPISIVVPIIPGSDLTAVPEAHHLIASVWGASTFSSGTFMTYSFANITLPTRLSIGRFANMSRPTWGEWASNLLLSTFKLEWAGGSPPQMTFSGEANSHIAAARAEVASTISSQTAVSLGAARVGAVHPNARVTIGTNTDVLVTAVAANGTDLTLGTAISAAAGDPIFPYAPARSGYSSNPAIGSVGGGFTLFGRTYTPTAVELTVERNLEFEKNTVGASAFTEATAQRLTRSGQVTLRAGDEATALLARIQQRNSTEVAQAVLVIGNQATRQSTLTLPRCRLIGDKASMDQGAGTITVPWVAEDSTDGADDAGTWVWT